MDQAQWLGSLEALSFLDILDLGNPLRHGAQRRPSSVTSDFLQPALGSEKMWAIADDLINEWA